MLVSIALHSVVLFGISFVVIQSPWKLNEATIVNIKFADADFDAKGQSHQGLYIFIKTSYIQRCKIKMLILKIVQNLA